MAVTKITSSVFVTRASAVGGREAAANGHWVPNTDVYTTDSGLVVKVELAPAGYDLSQAKAAYLNGFLRIDVPVAPPQTKTTKVPIADGK